MTDRWGIPVAAALGGANQHDSTLLEPTLGAAGIERTNSWLSNFG